MHTSGRIGSSRVPCVCSKYTVGKMKHDCVCCVFHGSSRVPNKSRVRASRGVGRPMHESGTQGRLLAHVQEETWWSKVLPGRTLSVPEEDQKGRIGSSRIPCVCCEYIEGKMKHESVCEYIEGKMKNETRVCVLRVPRSTLAHEHLFHGSRRVLNESRVRASSAHARVEQGQIACPCAGENLVVRVVQGATRSDLKRPLGRPEEGPMYAA